MLQSGDYTALRRLFAFSQVDECNGDITTAIANRCATDAIFSTTSERSRWALHSGKKRDSVFGRHVSLSVLSDHSFADPSLDRVLVPVAERARFA